MPPNASASEDASECGDEDPAESFLEESQAHKYSDRDFYGNYFQNQDVPKSDNYEFLLPVTLVHI